MWAPSSFTLPNCSNAYRVPFSLVPSDISKPFTEMNVKSNVDVTTWLKRKSKLSCIATVTTGGGTASLVLIPNRWTRLQLRFSDSEIPLSTLPLHVKDKLLHQTNVKRVGTSSVSALLQRCVKCQTAPLSQFFCMTTRNVCLFFKLRISQKAKTQTHVFLLSASLHRAALICWTLSGANNACFPIYWAGFSEVTFLKYVVNSKGCVIFSDRKSSTATSSFLMQEMDNSAGFFCCCCCCI